MEKELNVKDKEKEKEKEGIKKSDEARERLAKMKIGNADL